MIIAGDGLYPDGPFVKRLKQADHRFILVAKEKELKYLFSKFRSLPKEQHEIRERRITHRFEDAHAIKLKMKPLTRLKTKDINLSMISAMAINISARCLPN